MQRRLQHRLGKSCFCTKEDRVEYSKVHGEQKRYKLPLSFAAEKAILRRRGQYCSVMGSANLVFCSNEMEQAMIDHLQQQKRKTAIMDTADMMRIKRKSSGPLVKEYRRRRQTDGYPISLIKVFVTAHLNGYAFNTPPSPWKNDKGVPCS